MKKAELTAHEFKQAEVLEQLINKKINQKEAAALLDLSTRQIRTKLARYRKGGKETLIHGSRGKPSKRKWQGPQREKALEILSKPEYRTLGPNKAAIMLNKDYNIKVSNVTLRHAMIDAGLWKKRSRPVTIPMTVVNHGNKNNGMNKTNGEKKETSTQQIGMPPIHKK